MRTTLKAKVKICLLAVCTLAASGASAAGGSPYPTQPIKMVVGFSAGSATDVVARIVAQDLSQVLGQQVLVDNKTGVGGSLAADAVATAKPDGYTLLFVSSAIAVNPAVYTKLPFDVSKDLMPIGQGKRPAECGTA